MSEIKERLTHILEHKDIPKEKFYKKIGMTSANFRGNAKKTPLNSNAIENILSELPQINAYWLVTGEGEMFLPETTEAAAKSGGDEILRELIREKDSRIEDLIRENERLRIEINTLRNGPEPVA